MTSRGDTQLSLATCSYLRLHTCSYVESSNLMLIFNIDININMNI